jgi:predicted HD phosphohydrolase
MPDLILLGMSSHVNPCKVFLAKHDVVGSAMVRKLGFSDRLARLVEGHVQAKRYLTFKVEGYYEALSDGSKFTLSHQGGTMTEKEANAFEKEADFNTFCQMRR